MSKLAVILLGPPAAGKGTQARMIGSELHFPVISTGDILRDCARKGSDLGIEVKRYMDAGSLVPDSLVNDIVQARLAEADCANGFILDGYPRTLSQAHEFEKGFAGTDTLFLVIGIGVPDEVLVQRVAGRRSCSKCGKVFGAAMLPAQEVSHCDECGSELISRRDDTAEVMVERLEVYHRQTQPLIDYYAARGCYVAIDGSCTVDQVRGAILKAVQSQRATVR